MNRTGGSLDQLEAMFRIAGFSNSLGSQNQGIISYNEFLQKLQIFSNNSID